MDIEIIFFNSANFAYIFLCNMPLKIMWLFSHQKSADEIVQEQEKKKVLKAEDSLILSGLLLLNTAMSVFFHIWCSRLDL